MRRILGVALLGLVLCAIAAPGMTARRRHTFLYVHDNGLPNQVWKYELGPDGLLEPVDAQPSDTQNSDFNQSGVFGSAAYSARRKVLVTAGGFGVSTFRVAADGSLSLTAGSPFAPHAEVQGVAVAEIGKYTYVYGSDPVSQTLYLFRIQPDGTLIRNPAFEPLISGGPTGIQVVKNLILFGMRNGNAAGCKIFPDGTLEALAGYNLSFSAPTNAVYADAKGKTFYVPDVAEKEVAGYRITAKAAKTLKNSPYSSTVTSNAGVASLAVGAGNQVFAFAPPNGGTGDIQAFKRAKNGVLTPSMAVQNSGLASLKGGQLDPSGRFLVVVDDIADQLKSFAVDQKTGELTLVDTETAAFGDDDVNALVFAQP